MENKPENEIVYFAETNFRNKRVKFGIKKDDRRRHMYLIGKTGMGKSTAMENMIIQDIANGEGVALVDPHGDLAEKILNYIPSNRINDVIYLNPADMNYPVAFNVMESDSEDHKHLIASGLLGVFKKLWADSWGPRLEYLLRNAILALLDYPGSTLLGVMRILADKSYRAKVITKIKDPVVKAFWVDEFSKYPQQFQVEAVAPIQNKVGQFLSTALIRNVVGQVKSSFDLRKVMDEKKILIMNLSKGRIGEDSSALLGAMMITKIQLAAMSRIDIAEEQRNDFYLYVDEFQNFATESFANILSEARKYRLNLIIGHQYIEQLDETVQAAVFGNVGTLMCFRVGAADAEFLTTEFTPYFTEEDLVNLSKYDVYMRLMIDGVASNPFSATTLAPLSAPESPANREKVIKVSRERFATAKDIVEEKISRWSGVQEIEPQKNSVTENKINAKTNSTPEVPTSKNNSQSKKNNKNVYQVDCYECGKPTEVSFKPDGVRPIYCQDCFQGIKQKLLNGDTTEIKIEEQKVLPEKEISLQEALSKPLTFFDKKKEPETPVAIKKPKTERVTPVLEPTKNPELDPNPKDKQPEEKSKIIEPGQVIKF
ncbi:MAG: type IV secretion system DNA-binding domain-containing protein [Patescibacteria group bacterium]|nr:type IV secretion system DNA-binding domain-containing protein [Patescibacteria group bacterium]